MSHAMNVTGSTDVPQHVQPFAQAKPLPPETTPTAETGEDRRARNQNIDVIRLIAAAGIIFVHATKGSAVFSSSGHLFRFAVPFFLFASLYFQSDSLRRRGERHTLSRYILSRVRRL